MPSTDYTKAAPIRIGSSDGEIRHFVWTSDLTYIKSSLPELDLFIENCLCGFQIGLNNIFCVNLIFGYIKSPPLQN